MGIDGSTGPASLSSPPLYLPEYQRGKLQSTASIVAVILNAGHGSWTWEGRSEVEAIVLPPLTASDKQDHESPCFSAAVFQWSVTSLWAAVTSWSLDYYYGGVFWKPVIPKVASWLPPSGGGWWQQLSWQAGSATFFQRSSQRPSTEPLVLFQRFRRNQFVFQPPFASNTWKGLCFPAFGPEIHGGLGNPALRFGMCVYVSHSVVSDSLWPYELQPSRLLCPWNSPGKNTGGVSPRDLLAQGSNPVLSHCRQILYHLSHQGSPLWDQFSSVQSLSHVRVFTSLTPHLNREVPTELYFLFPRADSTSYS